MGEVYFLRYYKDIPDRGEHSNSQRGRYQERLEEIIGQRGQEDPGDFISK